MTPQLSAMASRIYQERRTAKAQTDFDFPLLVHEFGGINACYIVRAWEKSGIERLTLYILIALLHGPDIPESVAAEVLAILDPQGAK